MYTLSSFKRGLQNPELFREELTRQSWRGVSGLSRTILNREAKSIPELDWDNLLLLDACRFDLFEECNTIPGELSSRYSVASNTAEYVNRTFKGNHFSNIVCVSSTPKYYKPNVEESFHDIIHVWRDDWDEEHRTVLPEVMNDRVKQANEEYPNKRILAHYIPPHIPFIGETGKDISHEVVFSNDVISMDTDEPNLWDLLEAGEIPKEKVWKAYRENLELILPHIDEMQSYLPGKTVVTSDHGNAFGEWGIYGHPKFRHIKPLIEVPWLVTDNSGRKEIRGSTNPETNDLDDELVEERLKDLGYK